MIELKGKNKEALVCFFEEMWGNRPDSYREDVQKILCTNFDIDELNMMIEGMGEFCPETRIEHSAYYTLRSAESISERGLISSREVLGNVISRHFGGEEIEKIEETPQQEEEVEAQQGSIDQIIEGHVNRAVTKKMEDSEFIIKQHVDKIADRRIEIKLPRKKSVIKKEARPEFGDMMERAMHGINVMLVGPSGCGKTHMAKELAVTLDRPFGSISCSSGISESQLSGWLLPTEDNGKFNYVPSVFVTIYEHGGVFLFDEMDAADPNTLLFINQAIGNGSFHLPQRHENPLVKKHDNTIIIAACNTYGAGMDMMYSGRENMDEATLDRFRAGVITMDYDIELEQNASNTREYKRFCKWAHQVRKEIREKKLMRIMSTRFMLDAANLIQNCDYSTDRIKEIFFQSWSQDERNKVGG